MKIYNQLGNFKIKKLLSVVLTASIITTSFSSVMQVGAQTEEVFSKTTQVTTSQDDDMQTATSPVEKVEISNKYDFDKLMLRYDRWENGYMIILSNDIDMEGMEFNPIKEFSGVFDGQGHIISNFVIKDKSNKHQNAELAFINTINSSAQIKDITFDNYTIEGKSGVKKLAGLAINNHGSISGVNIKNSSINKIDKKAKATGFVLNNDEDGVIENCHIENMSAKDAMIKSGFVLTNSGKIANSSTTLSVNSKDIAGGFCAINSGEISYCKAEGNVTAKTNSKKTATICGGFVCENRGIIKESNSAGKVEGQECAGGFAGINNDKGKISSCQSTGDVESKTWFSSINCGGFVGQNIGGYIENCKSEGKVKGRIKNKEAVGIIVAAVLAVVVIGTTVFLVVQYKKNNQHSPINSDDNGTNIFDAVEANNNNSANPLNDGGNTTSQQDSQSMSPSGNQDNLNNSVALQQGSQSIPRSQSQTSLGENSPSEPPETIVAQPWVVMENDKLPRSQSQNNLTENINPDWVVPPSSSNQDNLALQQGSPSMSHSGSQNNLHKLLLDEYEQGSPSMSPSGNQDNLNNSVALQQGSQSISHSESQNSLSENIINSNLATVGNMIDASINKNFVISLVGGFLVGGGVAAAGIVPTVKVALSNGVNAGGFAGFSSGEIVGCDTNSKSAKATSINSKHNVCGGFIGTNYGSIKDSNAMSSEETNNKQYTGGYLGGFVGENFGKIEGSTTKVSVDDGKYAGGFCGNNLGEISGSRSEGNAMAHSTTKKTKCGGFVGNNEKGLISDCTSTGSATGQEYVGGFAGVNKSEINGCNATGKATAKTKTNAAFAGGFVGENEKGTINNCKSIGGAYAKSSLSDAKSGGFAGINKASIIASQANGDVYLSSGTFYKDNGCGGFVGKNEKGGIIENCYAECTVETTHKQRGGAFVGEAGSESIIMNSNCKSKIVTKAGTKSNTKFCQDKNKKAVILKTKKQ